MQNLSENQRKIKTVVKKNLLSYIFVCKCCFCFEMLRYYKIMKILENVFILLLLHKSGYSIVHYFWYNAVNNIIL